MRMRKYVEPVRVEKGEIKWDVRKMVILKLYKVNKEGEEWAVQRIAPDKVRLLKKL